MILMKLMLQGLPLAHVLFIFTYFISRDQSLTLGPVGHQVAFGVSTSLHGRSGLQDGDLGGVESRRPSAAERGGQGLGVDTLVRMVGLVWMVGIPRGLEARGSLRGGTGPSWCSWRALLQGTCLSTVSLSRTSWPWSRWRRSPSR